MFGNEQHPNQQVAHSRGIAVCGSLMSHVVAGALWIWLATLPPSFGAHEPARFAPRYDLVWMTVPGPGGGGGGGGNHPKVVAPVQQAAGDRLRVPTASEPKPVETAKEAPPIEPLAIPATPLEIAPPVLNPAPSPETSPAPDSRGGGNSSNTGGGEGQGSGLGPGSGGGNGGGAYRPGSGAECRFRNSFATPSQITQLRRCARRCRVWWF
jgi:protein TonB